MRDRMFVGLIALLVATAWLGVGWGDAAAQAEGRSKSKDKKKTEQKAEKEKKEKKEAAEKEARAEREEAREQGDDERGSREAKTGKKYKPKHASAGELEYWVEGRPPGWSMGKKVGWGGAGVPPGQLKKEGAIREYPPDAGDWDERRKQDWDRRLEESKEGVWETMKKRGGMSERDTDSAILSVDAASRRGVPMDTAEKTVRHAVEKGVSGEDIEKMTRAMAYGVDKNVDHETIGKFARNEIDRGKRGDELALSIYEEIDARQEAPKEKRPWWKRMFGG